MARALLNTILAMRLFGCAVTPNGISANIAMSLVGLADVATARSSREALASYLNGVRKLVMG